MTTLAKHPMEHPFQLGQPEPTQQEDPKLEDANGRQSISARYKKEQGVLSSARLTFDSSKSHQCNKTLGGSNWPSEFR